MNVFCKKRSIVSALLLAAATWSANLHAGGCSSFDGGCRYPGSVGPGFGNPGIGFPDSGFPSTGWGGIGYPDQTYPGYPDGEFSGRYPGYPGGLDGWSGGYGGGFLPGCRSGGYNRGNPFFNGGFLNESYPWGTRYPHRQRYPRPAWQR